jgi:hypothetical protein
MLNSSQENSIRPFFGQIREAILGGFTSRLKRYSGELINHTARTRACLINDLIVVEFMKNKLKDLGIRVFKRNGRVLFDIRGQVILHFKKLDEFLQSSNLQTEFAYGFVHQMDLPGIPSKLPRLIAGYIPSDDWTGIIAAHVTYPEGEKIVWSYPLIEQPQTLNNMEEQSDAEKTRKRRFRGKGGDGDRGKRSTGGKH